MIRAARKFIADPKTVEHSRVRMQFRIDLWQYEIDNQPDISNNFRNAAAPWIPSAERTEKKGQRVTAIEAHIKTMEPGREFTHAYIRDWWNENKPGNQHKVSVTAIRRDMLELSQDGNTDFEPFAGHARHREYRRL